MNRIRRVLLSRVGYKAAWYDGVVLSFHDPEGKPVNTIISLPNGEGKTTLLSLLLCTFDPPQQHFVQHLQKPHHHFKDYFERYPGFIVAEMARPSTARDLFGGGPTDHLVVGQAVVVRERHSDPERLFFLFTPNAALGFDDLPIRGLGNGRELATMEEVRAWIQEAKEHNPSFWSTAIQQDWEQRLDGEGVDPWLVKRQVEFCRAEAGIDAFLNFHSEAEFLQRFFEMALEAESADGVRSTLRDAQRKLRTLPEMQDRIRSLQALQRVFQPFVAAAGGWAEARRQLTEAEGRVLGLRHAIEVRSGLLRAQETMTRNDEAASRGEAERNDNDRIHQSTRREALEYEHHQREAREAEQRVDETKQRIDTADQRIREIGAAHRLIELRAGQGAVRVLEEGLQAAHGDLEPVLQQATETGNRLRVRLAAEVQTLRQAATEHSHRRQECEEAVRRLDREIGQQRQAEKKAAERRAQCESFLTEYAAKLARLRRDGMVGEQETLVVAAGRWEQALAEQVAREEDLDQALQALKEERQATNDRIASLKAGSARQAAELQPLRERLAAGEALRYALSGHSLLRRLYGAEQVDPDGPDIPARLRESIERIDGEIRSVERQMEVLERDRASIRETGLAAPDDDAVRALEHLRERGLQGADLYPRYIAQILSDPARARVLVQSDPSRFTGIQVYSPGDLETVAALAESVPDLTKPVVVSLASDQPALVADDRVVLPAAHDAAYSLEAAHTLGATLQARWDACKDKRSDLQERRVDFAELLDKLQDYLHPFGGGRLEELRQEVEEREQQLAGLAAAIEDASGQLEQIGQRGTEWESQRSAIQQQLVQVRQAKTRIGAFLEEHEEPLPQKRARLERAQQEEAELQRVIEACAAKQEAQRHAAQEARERAKTVADQADRLEQERSEVRYGSKEEKALLEPSQSLDELRAVYWAAVTHFEALGRERGIETLQAKLSSLQDGVSRLEKEYRTSLKGLSEEQVAGLTGLNLDILDQEARQAHGESTAEHRHWLGEQGARSQALKAFTKDRKHPQATVEDAGILDAGALAEAIETARNAVRRSEQALAEAMAQTDLFKRQADQLSASIKHLTTQARNLSAQELGTSSALPVELPLDEALLDDLQQQLLTDLSSCRTSVGAASTEVRKRQEAVRRQVDDEEFQRSEPRLAVELRGNALEAACQVAAQHDGLIRERIATCRFELDKLEENVSLVTERLVYLLDEGVRLLVRATRSTQVPAQVPHFGGMAIFKMTIKFKDLHSEQRRVLLRSYIDRLVREDRLPESGAALAAELVVTAAKGLNAEGRLGLSLLKPADAGASYMPVSQKVGSGGESMTAALLLYLLMAQLRAQGRAIGHDPNSGFLILDNPFGSANKPALIRPQVELARQFGIQLIYATGIQDYNALAQFSHLVRLRRVGRNPQTDRVHLGLAIEAAEFDAIEAAEFDIDVS